VRRLGLSLALAAALLFALSKLSGLGPAELFAAVGELDARTYFSALGVHVSIYLVRAARFRMLLPRDGRPGLLGVLSTSSAHNLAAYVLPAKTGEASFVVYLRALFGVPASRGLVSLAVSRLLDLTTLLGMVAIFLGVLIAGGRESLEFLVPLVPVLGAGALVGGLFCAWPHVLSSKVVGGLGALKLLDGARGQKLRSKLDAVTEALATVSVSRPGGAALLLGATASSVAIWLLVFAFYAVLARGAGLPEDLSFAEAAFGSSLAVLFNLLPINGFAGFGTQEAGWQIGFSLVGVSSELALSSGVAAHLVQLFNVVLLGVLGHLGLGLLGQKRPA
jgi:uncharacterized membrane protein YbhN (UPF0104 family)